MKSNATHRLKKYLALPLAMLFALLALWALAVSDPTQAKESETENSTYVNRIEIEPRSPIQQIISASTSTFDLAPFETIENEPRRTMAIAWGDVDGDGDLDLAVGNQPNEGPDFPGHNAVFENVNGQLNPIPIWTSEDEKNTSAIAWGDVDGDGDLDLAVGNQNAANQLFINHSGVLTTTAIQIGTSGSDTRAIVWGDIDGNGWLDLVIGNDREPNEIWLNNGELSAASQVSIAAPINTIQFGEAFSNTTSIALGDIDRDTDGRLDIVVGNRSQANLVYFNWGASETASEPVQIGDQMSQTTSLALGDINNDSYLDLVVGNGLGSTPGQPNAILIYNAETSQFVGKEIGGHEATWSVSLGDADGDGDLDLAVGNGIIGTTAGKVSGKNQIYLNEDGNFENEPAWESIERFNTRAIAWADIDYDGILDLSIGNDGTGESTKNVSEINQIYRGVNPTLLDRPTFTLDENAKELAWGFWNENNIPDLAILTADRLRIVELSITPTGTVTRTELLSGTISGTGTALEWGDIDNNGVRDLVVATSSGSVQIISNDDALDPTEPITLSGQIGDIDLEDIDGDGDLDLAIGILEEKNRVYLFNSDSNLFELFWESPDTKFTQAVAWGDIDGDGDLDLAVGNGEIENRPEPNQIFENIGGRLADSPLWESFDRQHTKDLAWGDIDGDGDLDLAVGNIGSPEVNAGGVNQLFENIGGTLSQAPLWESAGDDRRATESIDWGDIDGDGDLDLLVGNSAVTNRLVDNEFINHPNQLFENVGGTLAPSPWWVQPEGDQTKLTQSAMLFDVDLDGDLDLTFGNFDDIDLYLNQRQSDGGRPGELGPLSVIQPAPQLLDQRVIPINYRLTGPPESYPTSVIGLYSLDGGGLWYRAVQTDTASTRNLGETNIFQWDTFASGFYGRSENVVFRLVGLPTDIDYTQAPTVSLHYTNRTPFPIQRPFVTAQTEPFRVRGTQIQVLDGADSNRPAEDGVVYLLPQAQSSAGLMGSPNSGRIFSTDTNGYLNGRAVINPGDRLMALLPVSTTYRIPPQLFFPSADAVVEIPDFTQIFANGLTIEMWLFPESRSGQIMSSGRFTLSYSSGNSGINETDLTTITLQLSEPEQQIFSASGVKLNDGQAHHLALSLDPTENADNLLFYLDGNQVATHTYTLTDAFALEGPLYWGGGFRGSLDELRLWEAVREPITETLFVADKKFDTSDRHLDEILDEDEKQTLVGYWPIDESDQFVVGDRSARERHGEPIAGAGIGFKPLYTLFHTSGPITNTADAVAGVTFREFITPSSTVTSVTQLVVSPEHPLMLFDLDVSLEWDGRRDSIFIETLDAAFKEASAILYDVTDGQVGLGQINLYHEKAYWGVADIVIFADNSLRPSAAIGGVVNRPVSETTTITTTPDAYLPGQIRMGTTFDSFGDRTDDLGPDWTRALAHELAHYLLFLPDNYLGVNETADGNQLRLTSCPGSFMTSVSDPSFSEFLTEGPDWDKCAETFAAKVTERSDWETIKAFYPELKVPTQKMEGPTDLPLQVTQLIPWGYADSNLPFEARNYDIRDANGARIRLPSGQAFLLKRYDPNDPTDDLLIRLGNPTGGGDRLKVRGAEPGDRLCLIDLNSTVRYVGCADPITTETASLEMVPLEADDRWNPLISADAISPYAVTLTVTQPVSDNTALNVQLFPLHYGSLSGNAPTATVESGQAVTLETVLPAFEIAVRVWSEDREAFSVFRLNPEKWESQFKNNQGTPLDDEDPLLFAYAPVFGPNSTVFAGPNVTGVGGPNVTGVGGPNVTGVGGPNVTGVGGPNVTGVGGPNVTGVGGPNVTGVGGPNITVVGGPNVTGVGGPNVTGVGGPNVTGVGGPNVTGVGGPNVTGVGGPNVTGVGGPNVTGVGGPNVTGVGGPNVTGVGGAGQTTAGAPILSADAQVAIYDQLDFFAPNGVRTIQALSSIPLLSTHPWLQPVGQAYQVTLKDREQGRFISLFYQQRDVPQGYEHILQLYFLENGGDEWIPLDNTVSFVENLLVADLQNVDGIYAAMSSIALPELNEGWNLFSYPLPDLRCLSPVDCMQINQLSGQNEVCRHVDFPEIVEVRRAESDPINGISRIGSTILWSGTGQMMFEPNVTYWVKADKPFEPRFSPPMRGPNGIIPCLGSNTILTETAAAVPEISQVYVSFSKDNSVAGIIDRREDIYRYDIETETWSIYFDGSDLGLQNDNIDAFHILSDGAILFSVQRDGVILRGQTIKGRRLRPLTVNDADIILFTPESTGQDTRGSFNVVLKESYLWLSSSREDIDALARTNEQNLAISTIDSFFVGLSGRNEDLIEFNLPSSSDPNQFSWGWDTILFDGSRLTQAGQSRDLSFTDIEAVSILGNDLYLVFDRQFSSQSIILRCTQLRNENGSRCDQFDPWAEGLFNGSIEPFIDGLHVSP